MLDKNQERLETEDYVELTSSFSHSFGPFKYGIIARIDLDSDTAENILVLVESKGMPLPIPSAASSLIKVSITEEDKKANLNGVLSTYRDIEADLRFA